MVNAKNNDLSRLINSLPGIIYRCQLSRSWTMEYISEGCLGITGYSSRDLKNDRVISYGSLIHPEDREYVWNSIHEAVKQDDYFQLEYRIIDNGDNEKWVWEQGHNTGMKKDNTFILEGFIIDITSYKNLKEKLRISEERYQEVLSSIEEGYYEVDLKGNVTGVNQAITNMTGYSREELLGNNYKKFVKNPEEIFQTFNHVYQTGTPCKEFHWKFLCKDNSELIVEVSVSPVKNKGGEITGFRGILRDVTDRIRMEEALKQSEERYREILFSIEEGYYEVDLKGNFTFVNEALLKQCGYSYEELLGQNFRILAREPEKVYQTYNQVFQTGEPEKNFIWEVITRQGNIAYSENSVSLIKDKYGQPVGFRGITRDITERRQAELEVQLQKTHFEALFAYSTDAIVFFDRQEKINNVNNQFINLFGYSLKEIKGTSVSDLILPPEKKAETRNFINKILKGEAIEHETTSYHRDGETIEILFKGVPVVVEGEVVGGYAIYSDITTRKHYEQKLKYMSMHDTLTGTYNRAYFENEINRLNDKSMLPVTIIVADIDNLKFINDTMGHDTGDKLLIECARILQSSVRDNDRIARIGGDEFIIILPQTDQDTGLNVAGRISQNITQFREDNPEIPLSISLGTATAINLKKPLMETYKTADNEMYRDKLAKSSKSRGDVIDTLINTLSEKDFILGGHAERMSKKTRKIGEFVGLKPHQLNNLTLLSHMHDLGKVGISDNILLKKGTLTREEWEEMKLHPKIGYRIAKASEDLKHLANLILYHHERWDGKGYPYGLKGEEIPMECRILAIVDAFDAMTSDRPYRKALSAEDALAEIKRCAGTQFDPYLAEIFIEIFSQNKEESPEEVKSEGENKENSNKDKPRN